MAPRTVYANLVDGLQPFFLWDQSLADMGSLGITPCTAAGTNAVVLTPIAAVFAPTVSTPQSLQAFSFVAVGNSTSAVTVQIGSLTAKPLYRMDGVTQAASSDLLLNVTYVINYNAALNGAAGGFQILAPINNEINPIISGATISNSTISGSAISGATSMGIRDTSAAFDVVLAATSSPALTAQRTLTFDVENANVAVHFAGGVTFGTSSLTYSGNFAVTNTYTAATNVTFPTSGTLATLANAEALTNKTINGNTFTAGTYTLTGVGGKTLTFNNSLTLAGVDATTLTFQGTDTYIGRATTDTLTNKTISTTGTGNHIQIGSTDITQGQILGEASTGNASAGNIGEYIESVIATGSALALTTNVAKTITSIVLTAGDWDISGNISFNAAGSASITFVEASLSLTTNVVDQTIGRNNQLNQAANVPATVLSHSLPVGPVRISTAGTTVFLVASSLFTVGTLAGWGIIRARRAR